MMAVLALLEGGAIFASVLTTVWGLGSGTLNARMALLPLALATGSVAALYFHDAYDARIVGAAIGRRSLRCGVAVLVLLAPIAFLLPSLRVPLAATVLAMVTLVPLLRAICSAAARSRLLARRVLIVGTSRLAFRLAEEITARARWCRIVGLVGNEWAGVPSMPWPMLGPLDRLAAIITETKPHRIVVALSERRGTLPVGPLFEAQLRGIRVEEGVDVYERITGKLAIEWLTPSPLIFSPSFRRAPITQTIARVSSLVASVIGLVLGAPIIGLVALLVRLDSRGPVFFVQERVGQGGKVFRLIKFRTMHPAGGPRSEWARDNDDRITRVGRWLRKFRLDELPQLVNVLYGDMNLVGPRPHPLSNFSLFVTVLRNCPELCEQIPYYSLRLAVRPGVTGWAQVRYRYANDLEEEVEKTCYDLYYIKHLSLWLDLRILLDTVKTVLAGHGAGDATEPVRSTPSRPADVIPMPAPLGGARVGDRRPVLRRTVGALAESIRDGEGARR